MELKERWKLIIMLLSFPTWVATQVSKNIN